MDQAMNQPSTPEPPSGEWDATHRDVLKDPNRIRAGRKLRSRDRPGRRSAADGENVADAVATTAATMPKGRDVRGIPVPGAATG